MVTYEGVCDKMECTIEKFVDMAKSNPDLINFLHISGRDDGEVRSTGLPLTNMRYRNG